MVLLSISRSGYSDDSSTTLLEDLAWLEESHYSGYLGGSLYSAEDQSGWTWDAALYFPAGPQLQLSVSDYSDDIGNDNRRTQAWLINAETDPFKSWQYKCGWRSWGNQDFFELESWSLGVNYNHTHWSVGFEGSFNEITIVATDNNQQIRRRETTSVGQKLSLILFPSRISTISLTYQQYNYEDDPEFLDINRRPQLLRYLSLFTLSLAQGLEDNRLGLQYSFHLNSIETGISYSRSTSAVDQIESTTTSLYIDFAATRSFDFLAEMGVQESEITDSSRFLLLGSRFRW